METVRLIPDPHKRMRLGLLLDRLTTQLHKADCFRFNLPNYPDPYATEDQKESSQRYATHDAFGFQEVPLDLSLKHESSRAKIKTETGDESPPQLVPQCNYKGARVKSEPTPPPLRVVEQVDGSPGLPYVCDVCGQMFSLHDRLAKHVASRHRSKRSCEAAGRNYECATCGRRFARSDMLTRHARLHTGLKPYSCNLCGQVFSRSDHLATHQRTHTGEKPYKCPQCSYAACRRDMITRHMRTHARPSSASEQLTTEVLLD